MSRKIPPTGRITLTLDWSADLAVPPRCGATVASAEWTLPTGFTEVSSSNTTTVCTITFTTSGLKLGKEFTLICRATLSNGDIIPAGVDVVAAYRESTVSTATCP